MTCVTSEGYQEGSKIYLDGVLEATRTRQAGAVAIAILNATQLIDNAKALHDIQSDTLALAEEMQNRQKNIFWPKELEFLAEFATKEDFETADAYGKRFAGRLVASVAGAFSKKIHQIKCNASRYCTSDLMRKLQALNLAKAEAIANARVLGRQMGFAHRMAQVDRNDQRRLQAIALSKDLFQTASNLYKNAVGGLADAGKGLFGDLNAAMEAFTSARGVSEYTSRLYKPKVQGDGSTLPDPYRTGTAANPTAVDVTSSAANVGYATHPMFDANDPMLRPDSVPSSDGGTYMGLSGAQAEVGLTADYGASQLSTYRSADVNRMESDVQNEASQSRVSLARIGTQPHNGTTQPAVVGNHGAHTHDFTVRVDIDKYAWGWTDSLNHQKTFPDADL